MQVEYASQRAGFVNIFSRQGGYCRHGGISQVSERREHPRVAKFDLATINTGFWQAECIVHDLSERGARLQVLDPQRLPSRFELIFAAAGGSRWCRLVWQHMLEAGVAFDDPAQELRDQAAADAELSDR
jgi:hypothetical protein